MKPRNPVILTRHMAGKLKRQDILKVDALYMVTYDGEFISVALVDENMEHNCTPRYQNNLYSQEKSAQNAADKMNTAFDTDRFQVRQIRYLD